MNILAVNNISFNYIVKLLSMSIFNFFKAKPSKSQMEIIFEQTRQKININEKKSNMHDIIISESHDNSCSDVNPSGFGKYGIEKTNPIPVYGFDNIAAYMDKLRYKYTSEVSGNFTFNPISYMRTFDDDNSPLDSMKPEIEINASSLTVDNINGLVEVYNIYSQGNKKIAKIYINPFSLKTSNLVPEGFFHREEIPILKDGKILMEVSNYILNNYK